MLSFTPASEQLASDTDVLMCYGVLLGRDPENSFVIQEATTQPVRTLLRSFINSDEFRDATLEPFRNRTRLRHETHSVVPGSEQIAWLLDQIGLDDARAGRLQAAKTWRDLFEVLFSMPGFLPGDNQMHRPAVGASQARFADAPPVAEPGEWGSAIIGRIEECRTDLITGWVVNRDPAAAPVAVALALDGEPLGTVRCDQLRPDVQRLLGGSGVAGFAFRPTTPLPSPGQPAPELVMMAAVEGSPVIDRAQLTDGSGRSSDAALDELAAWLDTLTQSVAEIRQRLPELRERIARRA
jgi:hypothetical protein